MNAIKRHEHADVVRLLTKAKNHLARAPGEFGKGWNEFLCHAIQTAAASSPEINLAGRMCELIGDRLEGRGTYCLWLAHKVLGIDQSKRCGYELWPEMARRAGRPNETEWVRGKLQEARHAWLDSLIEEFSA
jgi:hypothetical protein